MTYRLSHIIIALTLFLGLATVSAQTASLTGDWTGESICIGNNPNCRDERVDYHISVDPSDAKKVKIAADKIVDGKLDPMGVIDLKYDASKNTLVGDLQNSRYRGVWQFSITGNTIEGTLSLLPDNTIVRRIKVQKTESTQRESSMTQHATGAFDVKITPQEDKLADKSVGRMTIDKQWHGDLEGTSTGQMLTGGDATKGSAGYVAIEKVTGTLSGRKGTFILQHSATMTRGKGELTITVVPGSGTDELEGIVGKLMIRIEGGKHFYDFEYAINKTP